VKQIEQRPVISFVSYVKACIDVVPVLYLDTMIYIGVLNCFIRIEKTLKSIFIVTMQSKFSPRMTCACVEEARDNFCYSFVWMNGTARALMIKFNCHSSKLSRALLVFRVVVEEKEVLKICQKNVGG
jgi:hypothetical protein